MVRAYKDIIKIKMKNVICIAYRFGLNLKRFKENVIAMISDFCVSRSAMINITKLLDKYSKLK